MGEAKTKMSTVYISFCAEINFKTAQNLLGVTFDQIKKGATHIYYLLSTPGGLVDPGIAIYNTLKGLPVKITMHNVGQVDSIGNAIFLAGKERLACKHSSFMFHGVGFDIPSACRLEEKRVRETLDAIKANQVKIGGIVANETTLKEQEINGLFLEAQTKDATFALSSGIVHRIEEVAIPQGAPLVQLIF